MQPTDDHFAEKLRRFFDGALDDAVTGIAFAERGGEDDHVS